MIGEVLVIGHLSHMDRHGCDVATVEPGDVRFVIFLEGGDLSAKPVVGVAFDGLKRSFGSSIQTSFPCRVIFMPWMPIFCVLGKLTLRRVPCGIG